MSKSWQVSLTVAFIALGVLLSLQFRTQQEVLKDLTSQKPEELVIVLKKLSEKRSSLLSQLWDLRSKARAMESETLKGKALYDSLKSDIANLEAASGSGAINGPGIQIKISADTPVFYEDLMRILNELWNVGTEGIAVNGLRLSYFTSISEDPNTLQIKVGDQPINYPVYISAIGNPEKLRTGILIAGGTIDQLRFYSKVNVEVTKVEDLVLPVSTDLPQFKYSIPATK